ncbi:hypothetical protein AC1031_021243 [Aphanomyces cochlioides]|nr:hypothetical protein AC1031_021243 [Aphanomyces cochlioides]
MSVDGPGCFPSNGSNNTNMPPMDAAIQFILVAFVVAGTDAPAAILYYFLHRHNPTMHFRSPVDMVIAATSAFVYSTMRYLTSLFADKIACSIRYLSIGIPIHFILFGYALAELR